MNSFELGNLRVVDLTKVLDLFILLLYHTNMVY